jgi:hypothetical protein
LIVKGGSIQDATFITSDREDRATTPEVTKPELAEAKKGLGLRRERRSIMVLSFVRNHHDSLTHIWNK